MSGKKRSRPISSMSTSSLQKKARAYLSSKGTAASRRNKAAVRSMSRGRSNANIRTGGFLGIELKYKDSSLVSSALVAPTDCAGGEYDPATLLALNSIAQGDGEQERDGKQVCVKSVFVSGVVDLPATPNLTAGALIPNTYVALVLDKQTNGAQLNSEDVFTNPGASAVTASSPLRDLQYTSRFQVLDHVLIEPQMPSLSYDGTNMERDGCRVPFKLSWQGDLITNYIATTAVVAAIQDHSLHIVAFTSAATGSTISYNARVRFVG